MPVLFKILFREVVPMRCSIVFILLAITFGRSLSQHCEVDESQHECGGYCYGAVKPVLDYLAILQKRVESCEAKQPADTLSKIALMNEKLDTLAGHMATQQYLEKRSTAKTHELEQQVAAVRQELDTKSTGLQELGNSSKILEQKVAAVRQEMGEKIETLGKQMAIQQELESKSGEHVHKLELQLAAVRKERDEKLDTLQAMEKSLQENVKKLEQQLRQERDERSTGLQDLGNSSQAKIHILEQKVAAVRQGMGEKIETLGKQMAIQQELESKSGEHVHKLELQLASERKKRDEQLDTLQAMEKSLQENVKKLEQQLRQERDERSTGLQDLGNSSQAKIHILEQKVAAVRQGMGEKIETLGKQMAIQQELESKSGEHVHKLELQLAAVRKERDEKLDTLQAMEKSLQENVKKLEQQLRQERDERSTGLQELGNSSQILEQKVAAVRQEMGEKIETLGKQMAIQQELENKSGEHVHKLELQLAAVRKERDEKLDTLQAMEKSLQEKVKKFEQKLKPKNLELFKKIGSKYYYIENTKKTNWQGALDICQEMGAHLVSLQNEDELKALDSMLDQNKWYWIDLKKLVAKGEFISATTGVKGTFFHWREREPFGENCDCVFLYQGEGEMGTYPCDDPNYFICEAYWVD